MIKLNYENVKNFIEEAELNNIEEAVRDAHNKLHNKSGAGNEYLGWLGLPENIDDNELSRIKNAASKIRNNSQIFLVIGIGGSYLGTRAGLGMLTHEFSSLLDNARNLSPQVLFMGHNLSSGYIKELMEILENVDFSVNVISKSGTTTEPAIAFRIIKKYMESRYSKEEIRDRIYITTDKRKGKLKELADIENYETFVIPEDIGGRYSVLTPVGLLPLAVAGIDISEILKGAKDACLLYENPDMKENNAYLYAAIRNILLSKGYNVEILCNYEPGMHYMTEWWKQLFGESEGKDGKGIFPAGVDYTTDLHSLGQYVQDGGRFLFETIIHVEKSYADLKVPHDPDNIDGLNYLSGISLDEINKNAMLGTIMAHVDGGVPNIIITIPEMSPYWFGNLVYFFEKACGISGYILGVNPFNQPGVEDYKKNMFALLGKPGFEKEQRALLDRINGQ